MQTIPSSIQLHEAARSAPQDAASPWAAHGSGVVVGAAPAGVSVVPPAALPLTPTLPAPQAQSQGGQLAPGTHAGQAQVQVPPPPQEPPPPAPQSQLHGAQVSPGAQTGQVQVQVPPPPLPPDGGCEQSHSTAGQSAFVGQAIGCTQVHPPPEASRV